MTIASPYGRLAESLFEGRINYADDTIKAMLCSGSYVPDVDAHKFKSDVTGEISGTGYTAGGIALTGKTVTYDASTNTLVIGCSVIEWLNSTLTGVRYVVFYDATPATSSIQPLLSYMDFELEQSTSNQPFSISIPSSGLVYLTVVS